MSHYPEIEGYFGFQGAYDLALETFEASGGTFVEVGALLEKSAAYMAAKIRDRHLRIRFFAVDTWKGSGGADLRGDKQYAQWLDPNHGDLFDAFFANMALRGVLPWVTPLRMTSLQAAQLFRPESLDFVFIDAAHDYDSVKADLLAWYPLVKRGGVLAGDDYGDWPGVTRAADEVLGPPPGVVSMERHVFWHRKQ